MNADDSASAELADDEFGEAPGSLRLIEEFVNTVELPDGEDRLGTVASAQAWLARRGIAAELDEPARAGLVALREAIRDLLERHSGNDVPQQSLDLVMHRLNDTRLAVVITADGAHAHPAPEERGVEDFLGRLGAAMITANVYGTWQRLKTCRNDECRWAFYDKSKNARRVWCSMASCGCREKSRSYRARKKAAPVHASR